EPFNRAKSELHWLEYTLAGAATIAGRTALPGPYDVIRPGIDGLLAATPAEWLANLRALAGSAALRAELVGRARERVLAEYDLATRAAEWAEAYRWAAEHAGRGALGRIHSGVTLLGAASRDLAQARQTLHLAASAALAHRQRTREAAVDEVAAALAELRAQRAEHSSQATTDPLVSVVVVPFGAASEA